MTGVVYGVGLGPGDPELITLKADRLIREAGVVAYFRKKGRAGHARTIVEGRLRRTVVEIAMEYPVTTEIPLSDPRYNSVLADFYDRSCDTLRRLTDAGQDVVVLAEGDPFFYGSFMHIHSRMQHHCPIEVVPAVTGMSAAWTATGHPITWGDDVMTILAGTLAEDKLGRHMSQADALVIMKIGRNFSKVVRALQASGRFNAAWLVEFASQDRQKICRLSDFDGKVTPYFSIIVVHGQGRRPETKTEQSQ